MFVTPQRFNLNKLSVPENNRSPRRNSLAVAVASKNEIDVTEHDNLWVKFEELKSKFLQTVHNIRNTPIEFYEIVLYSVTAELKSFKVETVITVPSIEITHPLMKF